VIYGRGYPNPVEIHRSAFVRQIIRYLPAEIKIRVVAPVPYLLNRRRGKSSIAVPGRRIEQLDKRTVTVFHPRYPLLPRNLLRPVVGYLQFLTTFQVVRRLHREERIDLIHCNWVYPDGVAGGLIARLLRIPYIITEHQSGIEFHLKHSFIKRQISKAYKASSKVILVSQSLTKPLKSVLPALGDYVIIHNGVDVQTFPLRSELRPLRKIVYIGNLIPAKGLQFLLPALKKLIDEGYPISLDLIGIGSYQGKLAALSSDLGIKDRVSFKGIIPPDEIPGKLLDYDLLILPSLQESFGMVLIEAMATGMPVLGTRSGGPESVVTPSVGELVEPGSMEALYEGFKRLNARWESFDPQEIRAYCSRNYDLRVLCLQIAQVYHEVTGL